MAISAVSRESTVSRTDAGVMTCVINDVAVVRPSTVVGVLEVDLLLAQAHNDMAVAATKEQ